MRKILPGTFTAFFNRFGRPTEIQERGVIPILEGRNTLLWAPTASGKTETYAAPVAQRILSGPRHRAAALIITPTRALANDLKRRLEAPMLNAGVSFGRYTGEHKEKISGKLPEITVTTPEALDSLIYRNPDFLTTVAMVVLDELHILDGTARGDHVRLLLGRLEKRITKSGIQRIAASATFSDPGEIASRYGLEEIVAVRDRRRIIAREFKGKSEDNLAAHLNEIARAGYRKVLAFCNSRESVEIFSAKLKQKTLFRDMVFAHHGSLSRNERERVERQFKDMPAGVCLATLTLELGIDIGGIDYILLVDLPPDVNSLVQRIGRGSRRSRDVRAGFVTSSMRQSVLFRLFFTLASRGMLLSDPYAFRPGVLIQQALATAGSSAWVTPRDLLEILPEDIKEEFTGEAILRILRHAATMKLLELAGMDRFVLSERMERRYELGHLHSNISASREIKLCERITGDQIGWVSSDSFEGSESLALSGKGWEPVKLYDGRVIADKRTRGEDSRFGPRAYPLVPMRLARRVVEEVAGISENSILLGKLDGKWVLLHGLGGAGSMLLAMALQESIGKGRIASVSPYTITMTQRIEPLPRISDELVDGFLETREKWLAFHLSMGPFHKYLPKNTRIAAVRKAAYIDGIRDFVNNAALEEHRGKVPFEWRIL